MPSLRTLFGIVILYVLFLIYSVRSQAAVPVRVKISPPTKQTHSESIDIISAKDNRDGSVSIYILACGSMLEVIADREEVLKNDPEIQAAAMKAIDKACSDNKARNKAAGR